MNVPSKNGNSLAVPCLFLAPSVFGNGFSGLQIIVDGVGSFFFLPVSFEGLLPIERIPSFSLSYT